MVQRTFRKSGGASPRRECGCHPSGVGSATFIRAFLPLPLRTCPRVISFSDDRFPDNGKIELLFSATPEKIQGRWRAECQGTVLTRWVGGPVGSPSSLPPLCVSRKCPSSYFNNRLSFRGWRVAGGVGTAGPGCVRTTPEMGRVSPEEGLDPPSLEVCQSGRSF